jgi:NhaA family Na+:H+ antiporter
MKAVIRPVFYFFRYLREAGLTLIFVTILSLVLANSGVGVWYRHLWEMPVGPVLGPVDLNKTILHWINDGLMTLFFFLVGLEIKRELVSGELSSLRKALLPVLGAVGGMLVPALLYRFFNASNVYRDGWGIPMATDIAFALAILMMAGPRVPVGLKIFLTALAIIDDLGAVLVIAVFYTGEISMMYLGLAAAMLPVLVMLNHHKKVSAWMFLLPGVLLWYFMLKSGVHATIAGVITALFIPLHVGKKKVPLLESVEHHFHGPVQFIIIPLFALANTAIHLPSDLMANIFSPLTYGILAGLILGKPIGIVLFSWIGVKLNFCSLPSNVTWTQMTAAGVLGGIGFTMSIFISMLAFTHPALQDQAKVAVLLASIIAAFSGLLLLKKAH